MIMQKFRKILSGFVIAVYFMVYTAPFGLCVTNVPPVQGSVNKPVLRGEAKTTPAVKATSPSSLKLEGDISITKGNPRISLSLRDSDVKQVLRMFADKAGLNIVFHDSVNGKVTMDLVNVPLNDAFKMVMQITNLTYFVDKNTMVVAAAGAAQSLNLSKQEMVSIPVKYNDAAVMAEFLNKNIFLINKPGLSNSQVAITNPMTNDVLIFGTENDVRMARKIIQKLDTKPTVTTFVVNHTTPKEMATLLCTELLPSATIENVVTPTSSYSSSPSSSSPSSPPSSPGPSGPTRTPGMGTSTPSISGMPTGGAAESSGASSSSGSTPSGSSSVASGSTGGGSSSSISLGGGVIACQYYHKVDTGSLKSFNAQGMSISYFPQLGTISVVGGSKEQIELIKDFIAQNDKKMQQAYLEISLIELNESGMRDFSNTWQVWSSFFSGSFDGSSTKTNPLYPNFLHGDGYTVVDSAANKFAPLYSLGRFSGTPTITYTMNYLISNNKGRVLANPRIMITNGATSTIDLTSDYVKSTTSQALASTSGAVSGAVQKTYTIGNDDGIKVSMVPFISPDGYVTMNISPQYSTIKEKITTPSTDANAAAKGERDIQATLLQRRNLELKNVRIKDGETLVIGGMIREDETKQVGKIPVLGDLPGVGFFFRSTTTEKNKSELVIMITPKIIKDSEDIAKDQNVNL